MVHTKPLSLSKTLILVIGILNLIIAAPLGYMFYRSTGSFQATRGIVEAVAVSDGLYALKRQLSLERAISLSLPYARPSSREALIEEMKDHRALADETLVQVSDRLASAPTSQLFRAVRDMRSRNALLHIHRRRLDKALTGSGIESGSKDAQEVFDVITQLIADVSRVNNVYVRRFSGFDSNTVRQMRMTRFVWELGEYVGQEYAILGKLIARNTYPTRADRDALLLLRHRIRFGMELMHEGLEASAWGVGLLPFIEEAETHYYMTFEQVEGLLDSVTTDRMSASPPPDYPISSEMWIDMAAQAVDSLHVMTNALMIKNKENVAAIQSSAAREITVSFILFLCTLALSLYTWRLIMRRVIGPVNAMVEALYAEMRRDGGDVEAPLDGDEVTKLSAVLDAFRENARQLGDERDNARAASAAKSEFLANMSHEIRTPMNAVTGITDILSRSAPLTEKQAHYVRTLKSSADSLMALINDLLDFSRIEARQFELEDVPFDFAGMLDDAVVVLGSRAAEKSLNLRLDIDALRGRRFRGDPVRLRQIVMNLLSNAVKFTARGHIMLEALTQAGEDGRTAVTLSVTDTGIGIAADKIGSIFDKFTQADSSISRKYGGTGLGLSITRNLVEAMGGTINVSSVPGKGSVFTVRLSLPEESAAAIPVPAALPMERVLPPDNISRVLLVEDHEPNILVTGVFLEDMGYVYDVAKNGYEAVDLYKDNVYRVVLMDLQMPGIDGFEATRAIRKFEKENAIPPCRIIGLTAHAMEEQREKCFAVGMNDFLSKPFEREALYKKIRDDGKSTLAG